MTRSAFEQLVHEGVRRIPEPFRGYLRDIALVVEDEPTGQQRQALGLEAGGELFGLYEGTPRTERAYLSYRLPDKITIFQGPMERVFGGDPEVIREQVAHTVWHELAHALGMDERRVRANERRRRTKRAGHPGSLRNAA